MHKRKKNILIAAAATTSIGLLCLLSKTHTKHPSPSSQNNDEIHSHLYGTYQKNAFDNAEYLAVIPSSPDEDSSGKFQWYTIEDIILNEGTYHIHENKYVVFYTNGRKIAVIENKDGHYFLSDGSAPPQELLKISPEAIFCHPVN